METSRYRAFAAAAETGSLSRAAELLSYSPSDVSQRCFRPSMLCCNRKITFFSFLPN